MNELRTDQYKVLVTTSGIGSRLGHLTDYTNKSLVPIGDKLALSYIIECYPEEVTFVITLGHFGDHVREFLNISYPKRQFEFIEVSPYAGPESSLAFSITQAKINLQIPFIFHACDTLIFNEKIPTPAINWVAGFKDKDATNYATYDVSGSLIKHLHEKGMTTFDFLHIGLVGVNDYLEFWREIELLVTSKPHDTSLNDVAVLQALINKGLNFTSFEFNSWIDIGNSNSLVSARKKIRNKRSVLEKVNESVSFVDDSVVKFFSDSQIVKNRINRTPYLTNLIPKIESYSKNFYRYQYEKGSPLSSLNNPQIFSELLYWARDNLWVVNPNQNQIEFTKTCKEFYLDKTRERVNMFFTKKGITDEPSLINGLDIPTVSQLLEDAEKILLGDCIETGFHGDFILDNIIFNESEFKLIDWRQNFGTSVQFGDIYYDISKLNHSLHINHDIVNDNLFFVEEKKFKVECGILRKDVHAIMENKLKSFVNNQNLSLQKVNTLTSIIWLNMSPLHHHPFDKFLYYYGRLNLWRSINDLQT